MLPVAMFLKNRQGKKGRYTQETLKLQYRRIHYMFNLFRIFMYQETLLYTEYLSLHVLYRTLKMS
jgi:hypothetical protein